jgi:prolyl-tRNA synthetase
MLMPMVVPAQLWQETGRWDKYGKELLRIKDRHDTDFCLGPTHEEVITDLVRDELKSYKQLPVTLYQIQTKFRDEVRPRFGLMRCREFGMKDAYSFHLDAACLDQMYQKMSDAYHRIFTRCGLSFRQINADNGSMGGSDSSEFMVTAKTGEDEICDCSSCGFAGNQEILVEDCCPQCQGKLTRVRGIEVGHIFKLGDTYTQAMGVTVLTHTGSSDVVTMGCYGIGIGRTVAAAIEQHHDDKGIKWPMALAPYRVDVIITAMKNNALVNAATRFFETGNANGVECILDDRNESVGVKFKDAELIGFPYQVIFGRLWVAEQKVEVVFRMTGEKQELSVQDAMTVVSKAGMV